MKALISLWTVLAVSAASMSAAAGNAPTNQPAAPGAKPAPKPKPPPPPTYLTVETAGPDYAEQGEYADAATGAQVIALGDNRFRLVLHPGGLPGAGWDKSPKTEMETKREGGPIIFTNRQNRWTYTLANGVITVATDKGEKSTLKKVNRTSPTLGAKPPPGALVLFDGSNCDAWQGGRMDERKFLAAGTKTKQSFTNFSLHLEFLLPFKPLGRGQDRGNSGVYLQDRYEIQVLDSFGLKGADNECGGIYTTAKPAVNMCFPPLVWQTYDVDFTAAQFDAEGKKVTNAVATLKHNGVTIHETLPIKGPTGGGKKEGPTGGALQLQGHGNPVFYRNIWLVEKP